MKRALLVVVAAFCTGPCWAQWAVLDVANLQQSISNYAAMAEQISNQASQITNQVRQIQQFETQLKRMGDMANIKNIIGFPEFHADLNLPTQIKTWAQGLTRVDGRGLFGDTRNGIFREITSEFLGFDGMPVERDPARYKEAHALVETVNEFKAVQSDVYVRRENLRKAIGRTSEALQVAETEAEQQKLEAVLNAQYGQLAAVDGEVALSAAQVQVKAAESVAMGDARSEADAEARKEIAQQESRKLAATFKPRYECLLQYVTEARFSP